MAGVKSSARTELGSKNATAATLRTASWAVRTKLRRDVDLNTLLSLRCYVVEFPVPAVLSDPLHVICQDVELKWVVFSDDNGTTDVYAPMVQVTVGLESE